MDGTEYFNEGAIEEQTYTDRDDNTVYVGKKGVMAYVLAAVTQFNNGMDEVVIKARGRSISKAVDVAEILRGRFVTDTETSDIKIATEEIEGIDRTSKVSSIEITLKKQGLF